MSSQTTKGEGQVPDSDPSAAQPSREAVFEVLSNERRRYVLRALRDREEVDLGTLAEQVAAWEYGMPVREVTYDQRKRVYTALQQSHLPKMDDAGALRFDKDRGTVTPGDDIAEFDIYLEVVPEAERPRSEYYIGLAALGAVLAVAAALDVPPLQLAPDVAWMGLAVVLFGLSALVHLYAVRQTNVQTGGDTE